MHWFCTVDGSDGSEKKHGAHYVCVLCGSKKVNYNDADRANSSFVSWSGQDMNISTCAKMDGVTGKKKKG
jgi:hypothetical protein